MSDIDAIKTQLADLRKHADAEQAAKEERIKQRAVAAIRQARERTAQLIAERAAAKARG